MNCEEFRQNWTYWCEGWMGSRAAEMARHRGECLACARYDRQMRRLVDSLAGLPEPDDLAVPAEQLATAGRTAGPSALRGTGPRWMALAATLALGIALGLLFGQQARNGETIVAEPVMLESAGERRIAIAVDSPHAFDRVEFVVELPRGVELEGFPGHRTVRWEGSLARGRSRLQLPLVIGPDAQDGRLVARILRPDGERRLVVPLQTRAASDSVALATSAV